MRSEHSSTTIGEHPIPPHRRAVQRAIRRLETEARPSRRRLKHILRCAASVLRANPLHLIVLEAADLCTGTLEKAYLSKLTARLCGASLDKAELLGLGAELAMFSALTTDDWVDASEVRASRLSLHARHGPHLTVFAASCLMECAHMAIREACRDLPTASREAIHESFGNAVIAIQAGQTLVESTDPARASLATMDQIARLRCGKLIAFIMGGVGRLSERQEFANALEAAGEWIGIALQHRNDVQDFTVAYDQNVKPPMADLLNGQPNLVVSSVFRNLKSLSRFQRELLKGVLGRAAVSAKARLSRGEFKALLAVVEATGADQQAMTRLRRSVSRATDALGAAFDPSALREWHDYAEILTSP